MITVRAIQLLVPLAPSQSFYIRHHVPFGLLTRVTPLDPNTYILTRSRSMPP